jgi:AcrR family transcriptional regulator
LPVVGLREENKARRRAAILDAAFELLRSNDPKDLTTEQIAAGSGVSHATVFNLVGTREQLFQALIDRVLFGVVDSVVALEARPNGDPIAAARLIVDYSVSTFTNDSVVYRRVLVAVGSAGPFSALPAFNPAKLQVAAMREAQARRIVSREFDPGGLGRQIFLSYLGAMHSWSIGRLDDASFLTAARHGLVSVLAATATNRYRTGFQEELRVLTKKLAKSGPSDR